MKKLLAVSFVFLMLPVLVQAQCPPEGSLVPCGGEGCPCTLCHFFEMIQNIIDFVLRDIVPAVAVLMVVVAGAMMISAYAGSAGPEMIAKAKKILMSVIIGLFIIYLAWIIINSFLSAIGVASWTGLDNWWTIDCEVPAPPPPPPPPPPVPGCTDPAAINFNPAATEDDGSCQYEEQLCGNGEVEGDEECDDGNLDDRDGCSSECEIETYCGDGTIQKPNHDGQEEECDDGGTVSGDGCSSICMIEDPCGNGRIDEGEQCDWGSDPPELNGETCESQGYTGQGGWGLDCNNDCTFDYSECVKTYCGDSLIQNNPRNDDGIKEVCDKWNVYPLSCEDFGRTGGTLYCQDDCLDYDLERCGPEKTYCGDGVVQRPNHDGQEEECDPGVTPPNLSGKECKDFGLLGDGLDCTNDCKFDKSKCKSPSCGNDIIEKGEDCEGSNLNGQECKDLGRAPGTLACYPPKSPDECKFDVSNCGGEYFCGDGVVQRPNSEGVMEQCDGNSLSGFNCQILGFDVPEARFPTCLPDCKGFDPSSCYSSYDECLSCPGNDGGYCSSDNCPIGKGCSYVQVDLLGGKKGGICVNPEDCRLCGSVQGDTCAVNECRSIGSDCKFIQDTPSEGVCVLPNNCYMCEEFKTGCTEDRCDQIGSKCQFLETNYGNPACIIYSP